jgi:hypothetical protein
MKQENLETLAALLPARVCARGRNRRILLGPIPKQFGGFSVSLDTVIR